MKRYTISFDGAEFHPGEFAIVTLELGIDMGGITGMGVVVNILPYIDGCAGHAVLPLTIRTFAEPAGTENIILRIIKTDAGKGQITGGVVFVLEGGPATAVDLPAGVLQVASAG